MGSALRILTVDRNQRNLELLAKFLGKEGYVTLPISKEEDLDKIMEQTDQLGLALIDISGFDRRIWEYCEKLTNQAVPLLVISSHQSARIREESRSHGAQDVLFKPLVIRELTALIRSLIRENPNG